MINNIDVFTAPTLPSMGSSRSTPTVGRNVYPLAIDDVRSLSSVNGVSRQAQRGSRALACCDDPSHKQSPDANSPIQQPVGLLFPPVDHQTPTNGANNNKSYQY